VNVTARLGEFVACTPSDAIPAEARVQAKRAILDTLGVALAGSGEDASRIVVEMVREQGGVEEAVVLGHGFRVPASEAALANGTSAHALDFDDVSMSMRGHPSVPLLPAIFALGEKLGSSGKEVVEAFVLGFEVECKVGRAIGGPHYALGWHATSTFGTLGAAAACARLLRLDAERTQTALGIAASLASGIRQNFGTMTKPLHAGWAARNGVVAAQLAQRGFSADAEALEGENGFLRAAAGGAEVDPQAAVRSLGETWEVVSPGIGVKLYPCCYATHRAIDAALAMRDAIDGRLDDVDGVSVSVSPGTPMPLRTSLPTTGLEGKFSMEYCIASALLAGYISLGTFTDKAVAHPEAQRLMTLVTMTEDGPSHEFPIGGTAVVSAHYRNGETTQSPLVTQPRGDPQNPLSWGDLCEKFRDCAGLALETRQAEDAIGVIESIENLSDIRDLISVLNRA